MNERVELFDNQLEDVSGGYIGFNYDETTGIGFCGLCDDRSYKIVDYTKFQATLRSTEGQGDVARMKALLAAGAIRK